jgi:hypothetical protein
MPGELAKLAGPGKRQPTARHGSVTVAVTEHGTPLPRPARAVAVLEPSPGAAD